ncbi:MAG TPA: glycoside hydrolase family 88 protein [Myxococcales bacterium]|jgi:unsaturated chondroitin disaccharide hydrolase|nr:glycoside hydrolase family 88 protein [Myxococcales bacterium]
MSVQTFVCTSAALCLATCAPARAVDDAQKAHLLQFASERLAATAAAMDATQSPELTNTDGTWATVANTNLYGWTQGFFPGANWYLFDLTGSADAKARADRWTRSLEAQKTNTQTHDLGFKMYLSFGHAFRSTGDAYYKDVLLTAAASLASRYDSTIGVVVCCDWNPNWHRPVVADTMMNLELLHWGAANGGNSAWRDMAVHHALKMMTDLVRPDGSTFHVVDYSTTGDILFQGTDQGYSNSSTWTRGQAWVIYGYTLQYRYTGDRRMLTEAQKVADYYLARLGDDPIPNWDFDAPTLHKDTSAAAAVASALFELSGFVGDAATRDRYLQAANRMLDALASPAYLAEGTANPAILLHGSKDVPRNKGVDVGLIYGDHYFLEALARQRQPDAGAPPGAEDAGVADAGTAAGGSPGVGPGTSGPSTSGGGSGCATGGNVSAVAALLMGLAIARFRRRGHRTGVRPI